MNFRDNEKFSNEFKSFIDFVENIISILKKKISNFAIYNTTKNNNPIYYI